MRLKNMRYLYDAVMGGWTLSGMIRKKPHQAVVNTITLVSFLLSMVVGDLSYAIGTSIEPARIRSVKTAGPGLSLDLDNISVPLRFGEIRDTHKGSNGKTIIHIQDAHCNYAAQTSISGIIQSLSSTYNNVSLLSLEGGKGNYDLSIFTDIKDPAIREKVSDYFVKEGRVSGPEFFAINNPGKVKLFGIEDEDLYRKNLNAYRDSLPHKEEADKYLNSLFTAITNLKLKIYSRGLKELDEKIGSYKDNKIDFKDYVVFLNEKAKASKVDTKAFKTLNDLIHLLDNEKSINFKEANHERAILIDKISAKVSKKNMEELVVKSAQFKMGDISSEEFYSYLFKKAKFSGVDFNTLPNLVKYSEYVKRYESLDKTAIFNEVKSLEDVLIYKEAGSEDERTLYRLSKDLAIIKGILNIALTKEEFDYYLANKEGFNIKRFRDFINTRAPLNGFNFKINNGIEKLDSYRENMEKFYDYSLKRDMAFVNNIEKKLKTEKKDVTVLVTGGFHTGNLSKLLKERGYSYVEVMPKFGATDVANPYFKLISGNRSSIDSILLKALYNKPGIFAIAVETPLSEMGIDMKDAEMIRLKSALLAKLASSPNEDFVVKTGWGHVVFSARARDGGVPGFDFELMERRLSLSIYAEEPRLPIDFTPENKSIDMALVDGKLMTQDVQEQWVDQLGIKVGVRDLKDDEKSGIEKELKSMGISADDTKHIFLTFTIKIWNRSIGRRVGHVGKRPVAGRADLREDGVIYLSPVLLDGNNAEAFGLSRSQILARGLLHEIGAAYKIDGAHDAISPNATQASVNKKANEIVERSKTASLPRYDREGREVPYDRAMTMPELPERGDFATGEMPSTGQMTRREFLTKAGLGALAFTFIGSQWGCRAKKAEAVSTSEKATVSSYSGKYSTEEVVRDPVRAREFINEYLAGERKFFEIVHRKGIAVDGWNLNPETLEPESIREHTAASKESLDISILVKALGEDDFAAQIVGNGSKAAARQRAIDLLKEKIDSYHQFNRDFPVFGGFLPWIKVTDRVQPTSDWQDKVPALDNGEWVWSLYAAYHTLDKIGEKDLSIRYKNYFDLLRKNAPAIFYDKALRKIRAEARIKNPAAGTVSADNYENNVFGYFLDDPYEGIMMAYFLVLFTDLPDSEKGHIWDVIKMEKVKTDYGTTYKGWPPASPLDGSAHIKWPLMFLPITDNPIAMKIFGLQEKIRTNLNKYGTPASTNTPGRIGYTQYEANIFAPYGAFSMILYHALQGDVAKGNYGLAWLLNMLNVDKMVGPSGSGESFSVIPGTNVLDQISFINTCDGKMNIWLAMMGGVVREIREGLKKDGVYDRFRQIVDKEYAETFGDLSSVIDNAEFHLPVKSIVGKYKPTQSTETADATDMRELWQYPTLDKWGANAVGEIKNGSIYITYKSTDGGWGWVGGGLKEDLVPRKGSAIYISGKGSFKLKLETASKKSVLIDVKLKGSDVWAKIPLDDAVGKTFSVMVIDEIMGDIIINGMQYSPDGNAPPHVSSIGADIGKARGDFATGEMSDMTIPLLGGMAAMDGIRLDAHRSDLQGYGLDGLDGRLLRGLDPAGMLAVIEVRQHIERLAGRLSVSMKDLDDFTKELHVGAMWDNSARLRNADEPVVQMWLFLASLCHEVNDRDLTPEQYLADVDRIVDSLKIDARAVIAGAEEHARNARTHFVVVDGVPFSEEDALDFMAIAGYEGGVYQAGDLYFVGSAEVPFESVAAQEGLIRTSRVDQGRESVFFVDSNGRDVIKVLYPGFGIVFGNRELAFELAKAAMTMAMLSTPDEFAGAQKQDMTAVTQGAEDDLAAAIALHAVKEAVNSEYFPYSGGAATHYLAKIAVNSKNDAARAIAYGMLASYPTSEFLPSGGSVAIDALTTIADISDSDLAKAIANIRLRAYYQYGTSGKDMNALSRLKSIAEKSDDDAARVLAIRDLLQFYRHGTNYEAKIKYSDMLGAIYAESKNATARVLAAIELDYFLLDMQNRAFGTQPDGLVARAFALEHIYLGRYEGSGAASIRLNDMIKNWAGKLTVKGEEQPGRDCAMTMPEPPERGDVASAQMPAGERSSTIPSASEEAIFKAAQQIIEIELPPAAIDRRSDYYCRGYDNVQFDVNYERPLQDVLREAGFGLAGDTEKIKAAGWFLGQVAGRMRTIKLKIDEAAREILSIGLSAGDIKRRGEQYSGGIDSIQFDTSMERPLQDILREAGFGLAGDTEKIKAAGWFLGQVAGRMTMPEPPRGDVPTVPNATISEKIVTGADGKKRLQVTADGSTLPAVRENVDEWDGWMKRLKDFGANISDEAYLKDILSAGPGVFNIEVTQREWDEDKTGLYKVKAAAGSFIATHEVVGGLTINFFVNDEKGSAVEALKAKLPSPGSPNTKRVVTFARVKVENGIPDVVAIQGLKDRSYAIVYINEASADPNAALVTPVGACFEEGLAFLNHSNLENKILINNGKMEGSGVDTGDLDSSVRRILNGIGVISGGNVIDGDIDKLLEKIRDQEYSLAGITFLVSIRPVDTNEIAEFHKAEAAVLRAL